MEKPTDKGTTLVAEEKEKEVMNLFMAHSQSEKSASSVWIIDNGKQLKRIEANDLLIYWYMGH